MADQPEFSSDLLAITADIVSAHVSNNSVSIADLPAMIGNVHASLAALSKTTPPLVEQAPAVSIRASIKPDYIVCLEDGKKLKMLKRHLMTHYQMTPADYRAKWKLPADYPMVAPSYAAKRSALAHKIGLGRKAAAPTSGAASAPAKKPAASRRKLSVATPDA